MTWSENSAKHLRDWWGLGVPHTWSSTTGTHSPPVLRCWQGGHLLLHTSNPGKQPSVWSSSDEKKRKKRGKNNHLTTAGASLLFSHIAAVAMAAVIPSGGCSGRSLPPPPPPSPPVFALCMYRNILQDEGIYSMAPPFQVWRTTFLFLWCDSVEICQPWPIFVSSLDDGNE